MWVYPKIQKLFIFIPWKNKDVGEETQRLHHPIHLYRLYVFFDSHNLCPHTPKLYMSVKRGLTFNFNLVLFLQLWALENVFGS